MVIRLTPLDGGLDGWLPSVDTARPPINVFRSFNSWAA